LSELIPEGLVLRSQFGGRSAENNVTTMQCSDFNERVEAIFEQAVELPLAEREAFLDQACDSDEFLRKRIALLLSTEARMGNFLKEPVVEPDRIALPALLGKGAQVDNYVILREIGQGGYGVVYLAEQRSPIVRKVALKVIKLGMDTREVIRRFEAERQALAMMEHPFIARVLDAGATETGRPYFVMEWVRGIPITRFCRDHRLSVERRLRLFVEVCSAVQHAHQKGIIHRDLKPSNVLVAMDADRPLPKVIDFGIAKATQGKLTDKTLFTQFHQFIGTPAYTSPEQAHLSARDVDTRTDIYALGVLLYELLTGSTPFSFGDLPQSGFDDMLRIIREREPVRPSTRWKETFSQQRGTNALPSPMSYWRTPIAPDLDWIVLKAMEKDRARRYETASALAEDIKHYLNDEPVAAAAPSLNYRLRKFARRNKASLTALALVMVSLILGTVVSVRQAIRANRESTERALEAQRALDAEAEAKAQARRAEAGELAARRSLYAADMIVVQEALEDGNFGWARQLLALHEPHPGKEDLRGFEWRYFWDRSQGDELFSWQGHSNVVVDLAFTPDGKILVSCSQDRTVKIWDVPSRQALSTLRFEWPHSLGISPDGRQLVVGNHDSVTVWDIRTGRKPLRIFAIDATKCVQISVSPVGTLLAIGAGGWRGGNGTVTVWDYIHKEKKHVFAEAGVRAVFSPDGNLLATGSWNDNVRLWSLEDNSLIHCFENAGEVISLAFGPDGGQLATSNWEGAVDLWDVASGNKIISFQAHTARVWQVAFAPDGETLFTASSDQTIRAWDLKTHLSKAVFRSHGSEVWCLAFSTNGNLLATGSKDETIKFWDPDLRSVPPVCSDLLHPLLFSPDSETFVALSGPDGVLTVWDVASGQPMGGLGPGGIPLAFQDDGDTLVALSLPDILERRHLASGTQSQVTLALGESDLPVDSARLSPDGKVLATTHTNNKMNLWDSASGEKIRTVTHLNKKLVTFGPFSPDSQILAGCETHFRPTFWNLETREKTTALSAHKMEIVGSAFAPNGRVYATAGSDGVVKLWDVSNGNEIATLAGYKEGVWSVAFSPEGGTLASSFRGGVKLWNLWTLRDVATIKVPDTIDCVVFAPDGRTLACHGKKKTFLLHAPSLAEIESGKF